MKRCLILAGSLCFILPVLGPTDSAEIHARNPSEVGPSQSVQLPPEIQADKYRRLVEQLVRDEDHEAAREALEKLLALQRENGLKPTPEHYFLYARVWAAAGVPERAIESAVHYLKLLGRDARYYDEALDLINRAETGPKTADSESTTRSDTQPKTPGEIAVFDGIEFVWLPPGEFAMGSDKHSPYSNNEASMPWVTITRGFYLGKYEVTQEEWEAVMGNNPSYFSGCGRCPVEQVSWNDAQAFIERLNGRGDRGPYRLPTNAEWEFAVRAGTITDSYAGDISTRGGEDPVLNRVAWYYKNSEKRTHPVGGKAPNPYGLYDMLGNVWEWVEDWYDVYPHGELTDPKGPAEAGGPMFMEGGKAVRGGSYRTIPVHTLSHSRSLVKPDKKGGKRGRNRGFRLVRME